MTRVSVCLLLTYYRRACGSVRHRFQRVRLHYNKHAPRASQRVSARHARGVNGPLERRTVDSLVTVAAGNKNRVRKCSAMHYTMQKVDECVATRDDDRECISTFPIPPIPIRSILIPSHSHSRGKETEDADEPIRPRQQQWRHSNTVTSLRQFGTIRLTA